MFARCWWIVNALTLPARDCRYDATPEQTATSGYGVKKKGKQNQLRDSYVKPYYYLSSGRSLARLGAN